MKHLIEPFPENEEASLVVEHFFAVRLQLKHGLDGLAVLSYQIQLLANDSSV
jgi:hypothetical protein